MRHNRSHNDAGKLFLGIFFFSFILILIATLFPFSFHIKEFTKSSISRFQFVLFRSSSDLLENILLFVPSGFGLGGLAEKEGINNLLKWVFVLTIGLCLSIIVEVFQIFLPSRFPSSSDVLANLVGTGLGFIIFRNLGQKLINCASVILEKLKFFLTLRNLFILLIIYFVFASLITKRLSRGLSFENWDGSYHLIVGNEKTGNRPWQGKVFNIKILNRAISENKIKNIYHQHPTIKSRDSNLICFYELDQRKYFNDETGLNPNLTWKGKVQNGDAKSYKSISGDHWLETDYPVAEMINKIKTKSQFTLLTTVASDDAFQSGPARIISISSDPYNRNLTLAQEGSDLVFRLRTPLTGVNGMLPELVAPNIFADRNPHNLAITYDGRSILLFVDGRINSHSLKLGPGAVLWSYFFSINVNDLFGYRLLYHIFLLSPILLLVLNIIKSIEINFSTHCFWL